MIHLIGSAYAYIFGRPAFAVLNKGLIYLGSRGLGLKNHWNDVLSGERAALLRCVPAEGEPVVFDIGANAGDWTAKVLGRNPRARMHLFEPQKALGERLRRRFPDASVNVCATGDVPGQMEIFDYAGAAGSEHASLLPGVIETIHSAPSARQPVSVIRLDDYCREHRVERIDFLKIDVEGYELKTLRGCGDLLASGAVQNIQFEFNEMNIVSRSFMRDFLELLGPRYRLYRMLRSGLLPLDADQHWLNEQFTYQNVLATRSAEPA